MRATTRNERGAAHDPGVRVTARSRCLSSALDLMAVKGFNGTSMRDIAGAAGTSLSNFYNHFVSKSDVLVALLREANDELLRRIRAGVEGAGPDTTEQLSAAVAAYVLFSVECQTAAVISLTEFRYLQGDGRTEVVTARDTTEGIFQDIITTGMESGEFHTPHPRDATRAIVSICATVSAWYRADGPLTPAELAAVHVRYALALVEASVLGLAARTPA